MNCWTTLSKVIIRKISLETLFTTIFHFSFLSCHALTTNFLGCPGAYGMHYVNSKQFMLIYSHAYINTINSHKSCYSIYNNNIKISSHGLINKSSRFTAPTPNASKNVKFQLSRNWMKFDVVGRFHKTIPTVKSVSSSEI